MQFEARYKGKRDAMVLDSSSEPAMLYLFTKDPEQELQELNEDHSNKKTERQQYHVHPFPSPQSKSSKKSAAWAGKGG